MSNKMDTDGLSDEDLTAYLDGEADDALSARVESAIEDDPALRGRLAALEIDKKRLSAALQTTLTDAPPPPSILTEREEPSTESAAFGWTRLAVAAVVLIAVGFASGYSADRFLAPGSDEVAAVNAVPVTWRDYAATYHALYTTATLSGPDPSSSDIEAQLETASAALGRELDPADFTDLDGLSFRRAQVLGFQGRPLIQIAYLTDDGVPVALCLTRSSDPSEESATTLDTLAMVPRAGMSAAQWEVGGLSYLLIGGTDERRIESAAREATNRL